MKNISEIAPIGALCNEGAKTSETLRETDQNQLLKIAPEHLDLKIIEKVYTYSETKLQRKFDFKQFVFDLNDNFSFVFKFKKKFIYLPNSFIFFFNSNALFYL